MSIIATIGLICLAVGWLPQLVKVIKSGRTDISGYLIVLWLIGFTCMLAYTMLCFSSDLANIVNYSIGLISIVIVGVFWLKTIKIK